MVSFLAEIGLIRFWPISVQRNLIEKPQWFLWDVGVICKQYVVNQVRREAAPVLGLVLL